LQETDFLCELGNAIHCKKTRSVAERSNFLHPHSLLFQSSVAMLHQPKTIGFVGTYITRVENCVYFQHFYNYLETSRDNQGRQNNIKIDQREVG
jgi:hypothetical protein